MKHIRLSFFLIVLVSFHSFYGFILHQPGKFLKTYRSSVLVSSRSRLFQPIYRFVFNRLWKCFAPRHFMRFFTTSLFPFKQKFPINFKKEAALFSTKVDLKNVLIGYINQENRKISVAIYLITDKDISQALIGAHQRGVLVEIVTDKKAAGSTYSQIPFLQKSGISVFLYECAQCLGGIMHHKFALFSGKSLVWNGSFNFTKTAGERNRENVVLMENDAIFSQFKNAFKELKEESKRLKD